MRVYDDVDTGFGYSAEDVRFTYDGFGQLVRENNKLLDKTLVYEYNNIGNVIKVTVYGYTEGALGSVLSSKTFDYNAAKKDQLTVYNGSMLTYDANGCLKTAPGTVMNTSGTVTYGWTGGRLTSASWGSTPLNACTYAYDGYGRRINKTHTVTVLGGSIPSQTIKSTGYTYDQGGRLICERISTSSTAGSISTEEKLYLYDEASVVGMIYTANGTTNTYYFDKDVFGNVLGIHNAQGIKQCCYVYDAFGNCKVLNPDGTVNISSTFIGNINPFRYKGYYYDKETCLYYLGTRYYCPDLCRFISPDDVGYLDPSSINGLNLYAYCNNDPINYADPSGHIAITAAVGLSTAAYYAIIGILSLCAVATVGYVESETHVISNTIESIANSVDEILEDIKDKINEFATSLVVKNDYNSREKHHIVAKRDRRAWFSRIILFISGIDINDPINLVYVKKGYHRVMHTNVYYGILNISIGAGYLINGSEGVEDVLGFYQLILRGL